MIINMSFTSVTYRVPENDRYGVCRIYGKPATHERIANVVPKGAIIDNPVYINAKFRVDADKLLGWLLENGELE